ncbi:hypothetical protein GXM_07191 [Nostoc sphaeroides CCNUC1]|uniref:Uncharacterized protein n=1 Tax=Nostoc sphaeroides CCNUC1 TaxID=2653204 RepID=A0A5P8WA70_9NOSO|nr:hypothetical protein GXM_07191 [Nostoc sphaeroides CCNUC1]
MAENASMEPRPAREERLAHVVINALRHLRLKHSLNVK